jgi:hypothetical protein
MKRFLNQININSDAVFYEHFWKKNRLDLLVW